MILNAFFKYIYIYIYIPSLFPPTPVARHDESALQKEEIAAAPQELATKDDTQRARAKHGRQK